MSSSFKVILPCLLALGLMTGCEDDETDLCVDVDCGDHGTCNADTGACDCDAGWLGDGCDEEEDVDLCEDVECGDHGLCDADTGECLCELGWSGDACDVEEADLCADVDCGDHGTCVAETGDCDCDYPYDGRFCDACDDGHIMTDDGCEAIECQIDDDCGDDLVCNGAEVCDETGSCVPGTAIECGDNESCVEPDGTCECDDGYELVGDPAVCTREVLANFEDLTLDAGTYWNGDDESGSFTTGGVTFLNNYNTEYFSWDGFAYSNMTDTTTAGYGNQYSCIAGAGAGDSANYGVSYVSSFSTAPRMELTTAATLSGIYVNNATYPYLAMRDGDDFSKQFGGETGDDEDWFMLTIEGFDSTDTSTGTVDFYLADFRAADSAEDYIIDEWTFVDLTDLGEVSALQFALSSTDNGDYGMNTPAYFAIDDVMLYGW